jgi:hypothetical protein
MTRDEALERFRHLQEISFRLQREAAKFISYQAMMDHAKRLGLALGRELMAETRTEIMLIGDLALHTAREGRSGALDRYARAAGLPPGSDEALVLDALRHARFSVWVIERRHEVAGLVVKDILRRTEAWLMTNEEMAADAPLGEAFAGRVCNVGEFLISCGAVVPVHRDLMEEVQLDPLAFRRGDPHEVAQDPRFASAIYRIALERGLDFSEEDE